LEKRVQGFKDSPVKFALLLFSEKFNGAGKGSSDPPQNRRIKMLKNYKEQKGMENDGIETP
jgi:hypothetical protein